METKCICGRELETGKSLCYICETLALLKSEDCDKYIEIKRRCDCDKNIYDKPNKRKADRQNQ